MIRDCASFYIGGRWVQPVSTQTLDVENPATGAVVGRIGLGGAEDVDRAVAAARAAFPAWSQLPKPERIVHLRKLGEAYQARYEDVCQAISLEMGCPIGLAREMQAASAPAHLAQAIDLLEAYAFDEVIGENIVTREPIGVAGLIIPWNWPIHQFFCKVAPALAAGCTMVLKPSEIAPLSSHLVAQIIDAAGLPPGVFNLVHGEGPTVGDALARHPDVDLISLTGSTRSGAAVSMAAAATIKRVSLELGGKSADIVLPGADLAEAVADCMTILLRNSGQNCNAPSRLLVPKDHMEVAARLAAAHAEAVRIGDPSDPDTQMGPLANHAQFERVQRLIQSGVEAGARIAAGGQGRPKGCEQGHFVRPTVFADVTNDMEIAQEEIFGPVLCIIGYEDEEDAVRIANDTRYGLSGYVWAADRRKGVAVARRLRTGMVHINGAGMDFRVPYGGWRQSGNGREWGRFGMEEYLELKSMMGAVA